MKKETTYSIPQDSQPTMASEPAVAYAIEPAPQHVRLSASQQFRYHYQQWINEVGPLSNPYAIADNEHFRAIVKMGKAAVPFIVQKMKEEHSMIYLALERIFNERMKKPEPVSGSCHLYSWNPSENTRLWIERLS